MTPLEEAALDLRRKLTRLRRVEKYFIADEACDPKLALDRSFAYLTAWQEANEAAAELAEMLAVSV